MQLYNDLKLRRLRKTIAGTTAIAAVVLGGGFAEATTISANDVDGTSGTADANQTSTNSSIVEVDSNYPGIPYFNYWTSGDQVYLNWDYGHVANRPSKIEAIISRSSDFSNPSYIEVKPKGASFVPNIDGDYYLRVRFFDSSGNITHESIRKVIRNSSQTRDIKGLRYEVVGTGVKLSWANFVDGISSARLYVDGKLYKTLSPSDLNGNSYVVDGVKEGSEIGISITNGKGLEYNGFVKVKEGAFSESNLISLGLSNDGVGILVDLSKSNFKSGDEFIVNVKEKQGDKPIVKDFKYTLTKDKESFIVYPDSSNSFMNTDYVVTIKHVNTGSTYTYDYTHSLFELPGFMSASKGSELILSWNYLDSIDHSEIIWSTSDNFSSYNTVSVENGGTGVSFDTNVKQGKVYLILTTYDNKGRVISQNSASVEMGNTSLELKNFKGTYKGDDVAEFKYDRIDTPIVRGAVRVNDFFITLSDEQIAILNDVGSVTLGGFDKKNKYNVSLYLLDKDNKLYTASTSDISEYTADSEFSEISISLPNGVSAKYVSNPGVLNLLLDESVYDVSDKSPIDITVDGKSVPTVFGTYVAANNSININGLIPEKQYKNIVVTYKDKSGQSKSINIDSLLIKKGGLLDSFLINAYNKAVSRATDNIDEEGYNYWKNGLLTKNIGLSYFIRNLAYVPEFMSLINSPQDLVTRLYQVLVLREPDPQGMQFWTSVYDSLIKQGVSHTEATMKILTDMTTSAEFSNLAGRLGVNP